MSDDQSRLAQDDVRVSRLSAGADDPAGFDPRGDFSAAALESEKPKRKGMPRSYSTSRVTDDERLWASAAHASVWLTAVGGVFTLGALIPISVFVPLVIYFLFRRTSDYVAFHALQAFALQLLGTVGALLLALVGGFAWSLGMVIAALSILVLVGFILVPVWGIVGIVLALAVAALPLAMLLYGTIAAISTYKGDDYRYPFIARWVDRQLAGGLMNVA